MLISLKVITLVLDMNDDLTKMDLEIQRGRGFRGSGLSFSQCKVCCFFLYFHIGCIFAGGVLDAVL